MHKLLGIVLISGLAISGCNRGSTAASTTAKQSGPDVHSLKHGELMAIYHDCHEFGPLDDPRVKYTIPYCVSVDSAQASEGWISPNTATVDPKLNKLH